MPPIAPLFGLCLAAVAAAAAPLSQSGVRETTSPLIRIDSSSGAVADDTDFLFRLGLMEGHLMVAHELLQAKHPEMALPHFGHPVRELYDDISPYLEAHRFPAFDRELAILEAAAASAPASAQTEQRYQGVIEIVHKARTLTPVGVRNSMPEMIRICAETIDAASGEFNGALERGRVESLVEYHDSRGFLAYVSQELRAMTDTHKDAGSQGVLGRFRDLLAKAEWIVEPLVPDPTPRATVTQFRAIAADATALAKAN
jgi:hypothetical protein